VAPPRALVIGAGIGGLAAAIALRRAGLQVMVCEQARVLEAAGAGLSLWANAVSALERLELSEQVAAISVGGDRGEFRTWDGRTLREISSAELRGRFGAAHIAAHRADLQRVLLDALEPDTVCLGKRCVRITHNGRQQVRAEFADGSEVAADILVGADGLRSTVRACLWGQRPPSYAGYTSWRGVATYDHPQLPRGTGVESWGRGSRFGMTHIGGGRIYWFATLNTPPDGRDSSAGAKADLLRHFGTWHLPIAAIIEATDAESILRTDIFDRPPRRRWGRGRVTLLGDAAHPMTPNLGQGACMALEDAVVLADCVAQHGPAPAALRQYEARRWARTAAVTLQSRYVGWIAQQHRLNVCRVRDALIAAMPARMQVQQMAWIVGYRV
jgi:2-polyprenyl-6-methoxyphenol hydroxylase-like FAD-dependent oxidoreductase